MLLMARPSSPRSTGAAGLSIRMVICLPLIALVAPSQSSVLPSVTPAVDSATPTVDSSSPPIVMAPPPTPKCADGRVFDAEAHACCGTCAAGFGVALPCTGSGVGNDTVCASCADGITYSSSISQEETCQPCSHCPSNAQAVHRCNVTHNTKCECLDGYWYDAEKKTCALCFPCQPGYEADRPCGPYQNTHCRQCSNGYYSDTYGYATKCRLCSLCKPGQFVKNPCSSIRDTECVDAKALLNGMGSTDEPIISGVNLFPVYCAIPAVVLVSLIFFVIFKRWRQFPCNRTPPCKSAAAFNPHGPIGAASSSNSTSIVKGQQRHPCSSSSGYNNKRQSGGTDASNGTKELKPMLLSGDSSVQCLPKEILEQLERQLCTGESESGDWIALAKHLGYGDSRIKAILKDSSIARVSPAKQLLQDWSYNSHASVRVLADSLENIGRSDLSSLLRRDIDLSSKLNNNNKTIISGPVHFV